MLFFAIAYYLFHAFFFALFNAAFGIKERKIKSFKSDFLYSLITLVIWMITFLLVNSIPEEGLLAIYFYEFDTILPAIPIIIAFLTIDFIEYWIHFLYHKFPFLWKFHRFHHNPENLNWSKGLRLSIVESFTTSLVVNLLLLIVFGNSKLMFLSILFGIKRFYGLFLHSNTDLAFGDFGTFISSPRFHHWHHAKYAQNPINLSTLFPFWDKIFGTFYGEGPEIPKVYGIIPEEVSILETKNPSDL